MKGNSKQLLKFMEGSDKRFVIPVYQRNYDWKKDNCQQLLNDLVAVVTDGRPSHFFGSIVASTEGDDYIIIDGQQRLTTVSLLLLAIMNRIVDGTIAADDVQLAEKIRQDYLIDKWQPDERKVKLKPVKNDMAAFNSLFHESEDYIFDSNITQNYLYFYEAISGLSIGADELFSAIKKLVVIDITLENGDDPQLIFESLNSTGLDLSEADKIRNYVLMRLEQKIQEKMYEQYWNKMEIKTNYQVSEFVRQYLTLKQSQWPNITAVYRAFKAYAQSSNYTIEVILNDMLKYARFYEQLMTASTGDSSIDIVLKRLNRLERSVANPFFFALLARMGDGLLDAQDVRNALLTMESYLLRRLICEVPTNALNKLFATLNSEIIKQISNDTEYVPAMICLLERKIASGRFPNDDEFIDSVRTRDFYRLRTRNKIYLFDRLENGDSYECLDVASMMEAKENGLSVEHVMPQTLTESWKKDLGDNYATIHEVWKNRIANLTLTAYNGKYSNRRFVEKLDMKDGFIDSPLPLNKWIGQQDSWGVTQLEERAELMVERFLELWPYPKTSFEPKASSGIDYALNDEFDFSGTKIASYTLMGTKHTVTTWKDAAERVLREACELDPASLRMLAKLDVFPGTYLMVGHKEGNGWCSIGQDVFVYLATSTEIKLRLIESVFEQIGLSGDDLYFEIRLEGNDAE